MAVDKKDIKNFMDGLRHVMLARTAPIVKIFNGTQDVMYGYMDEKDGYVSKYKWDADSARWIEEIYDLLVQATKYEKRFKICKLTKKSHGYRFRFDNNDPTILPSVKVMVLNKIEDILIASIPEAGHPVPVPSVPKLELDPLREIKKEKKKTVENKEKKMNDFSLTNLKNAIINKVTTLDKKTITIIGIIILLLLIATRYQDIKDILIGIKDKVKRSKNFKAMVADGTAALDSLKKIVGVKSSNKGDSNEE